MRRHQNTSQPRVGELNDLDGIEAKPVQTLRIIGHAVYCGNCSKELATFYCPCGLFLCAFDMAGHKCLLTLRQRYNDDLKRALR
jgi:hypothetical protein